MSGFQLPADAVRLLKQLQADVKTLARQARGPQVGDLKFSALSDGGAGWLLCDGSAVTSSNPRLRAALIADGSPFGTSGSDPRLPDLRGRAPIGAGAGSGLTARALGATVGTESHTLTAAQSGLPAHTHNMPVAGTGLAVNVFGAGATATNTYQSGAVNGGAQNASSSHPNMQPSLVVNAFVYAG